MAKYDLKNNKYLKYAGMAWAMAGVVIAGFLIGQAIDNWLELEKSYFTALFIILFMTGYFYSLYRQLQKDEEK